MSLLSLPILFGLIAVALAFDFLNGLHDAANSIATIVSTRVLRPQYAVAWAAFFNFIAFLFFGLHVANTLGTGIIAATVVDPRVVFGALMGAILWNLITWGLGIPSSSSHALVGGLVGAGIAKAGPGAIVWHGLLPTTLAIVGSPLIGFVLALIMVLGAVVAFCAVDAVRRRSYLSTSAIRLGFALFARPWRQRCAEDHGHHCRAALFARASRQRIPRAVLGGDHLSDSDGARHADRRLAHREDDGLENHAADADAGFLRRDRRLDQLCSPPPGSAFRSRPLTRSPARSSASAPRAGCRPCAGALPIISSSPGSLRSRRRQPLPRCSIG